ncbi:GGDEF domain-containing protein [Altererythrobacter arenosus]|uniref:diguanylate cyclase n=1 Tax=Altererythrobacter arenosus TaxID=3032592 RepID=A0ABY8FTS0_9SPHN|nr:GGDEF domain-containing protein [Altererythrobacter sp. CAU 1644]WFL78375.1 GGDEF domain-containing protein [Altererythrobacter sp. CAU 1644]
MGKAAAVDDIVREGLPESQWPQDIRAFYKRTVARRILEEGRFLLILGMLICLATLAVDALVMPERLQYGAQTRILAVAPLTLLGLLAVAQRWPRTAAFAVGGSMTAFAMLMLHLTNFQPAEIASRYILGIALLPGIAMLILPFPLRGLVQFGLAYSAAFLCVLSFDIPGGVGANLDVLAMLATGLFGTYQIVLRHEGLRQRNFLLDLRGRLTREELFEANRRLRHLSERDPLTSLPNRRHFERTFEERFDSAAEGQEGRIALMMIDLDNFKRFNDRHGHQAGDQCLKLVGHAIDCVMRKHEATFARYGGEEFILAMREEKPGDAEQVAQRICNAVAGLPGRVGGEPLITTSVGVATAPPEFALGLDDLIEMADAALYAAKHAGRNRYELVEAGGASDRLCA